jgi:hypothetical protein
MNQPASRLLFIINIYLTSVDYTVTLVKYESNTIYINPLKTEFLLNNIYKSSLYLTGNAISATKPNRLMLFGETIAVYCENHTEHINTLRGQNAEF